MQTPSSAMSMQKRHCQKQNENEKEKEKEKGKDKEMRRVEEGFEEKRDVAALTPPSRVCT